MNNDNGGDINLSDATASWLCDDTGTYILCGLLREVVHCTGIDVMSLDPKVYY